MREDWVEVDYKIVVEKVTLTNKKIKQKEYLSSGKIPVIDQGQELIGGYTNDETKLLDCKLPVLVFGDHTKIVKLINFPFASGADGTKVLEPKLHFEPKLLKYFTQVLTLKIKDKGYARHYQDIEKSQIPLPPTFEQKAIVAKIEQLFSELDKGIESLKTAQAKLKIYRQAVLKKAFEGDYKLVEIGDVCDVFVGATPSRKNTNYWDGDIYWVSSGEVKFNTINTTKEKITEEGLKNTSTVLHPPQTILLAMIGEGKTRGQCAILNIHAAHNQNTAALRAKKELLDFRFLYNFLVYTYEDTRRIGSGNNQKALNKARVSALTLPLPTIEEQTQIVQEIESRLSVCDKIEQTISEALVKAEALRQSILKKAFEGKLLHVKELEAIKSHPEYESAEKLLQRIKLERAK